MAAPAHHRANCEDQGGESGTQRQPCAGRLQTPTITRIPPYAQGGQATPQPGVFVVADGIKKNDWTDTPGISAHFGGKLSPTFFEHDRVSRRLGIPFLKAGRRVLYHIPTVDAFFSALTVLPGGDKA